MVGNKSVTVNQYYRQNNHLGLISGNDKAARMTRSILAAKPRTLSERWGNVLTAYGDYFIRY